MADATHQRVTPLGLSQPRRRRPLPRVSLAWLGLVPFFLYMGAFLLLPTIWLALDAVRTDTGSFTSTYISRLFEPQYRDAFRSSIEVSLYSALGGGIIGLFVAYAAVKEGAPRWIRSAFVTFSGVAANFAGVPLAFAFVATLGPTGVVTLWLTHAGWDIYGRGFTLFGKTGLILAYIYFQLPLMILVIAPALDGMRREWREAATNLGASTFQFWRHVGLPILLPALLSAVVLLFANAFSAYATPYALSGTNLVPILIGNVMSGNLIEDPHFGDALALGMIVVIAVAIATYALLQRRANRWLR